MTVNAAEILRRYECDALPEMMKDGEDCRATGVAARSVRVFVCGAERSRYCFRLVRTGSAVEVFEYIILRDGDLVFDHKTQAPAIVSYRVGACDVFVVRELAESERT